MSALLAPEPVGRPSRNAGVRVRVRVTGPDADPRARRPRAPRAPAVHRSRSRPRRWAFLLLCAVSVGGLLVATVATQALVNQTSFRMKELQARTRVARQAVVQLQLQVADLSAPDRIVAEARALGLRLPDGHDVEVLPVRSRTGAVGDAAGDAPATTRGAERPP